MGQGRVGRERLGDLLDGADVGVGDGDQLLDARARDVEPRLRTGEIAQPGLGEFEGERTVLGVDDERCAGGEDARRGFGGQGRAVGLDDGQLELVQGKVVLALGARLCAGEQQSVAGLTCAPATVDGEAWPARPSPQIPGRRIDAGFGAAHPAPGERIAEHAEVLGEDLTTGSGVAAESGEGGRSAAGGDPRAGHALRLEGVEHRCILRSAQRVIDRECHHGSAEPDPLSALRGGGEQHERRGEPSLVLAEMVFSHPGGSEAQLVGAGDLLEGVAVALGGRGVLEQAGEQSQTGAGHDAVISSGDSWWRDACWRGSYCRGSAGGAAPGMASSSCRV